MLSELTAEGQTHLAVVNTVEGRWRLERIVEPFKQVAVDEELLAQQGHQIGEAPRERALELQIFDQQHGDQGGPDLCLDRVFGGTDECLNLQRLLQGLEQLNDILPINNGFLKSRSITPSIPCVRTVC